jgi:hypothetical protein
MTMSDRPSLDLFFSMFPGCPSRGTPAAAATAAVANLGAYFDTLDEIDALLRDGISHDAAGDPNDVLKALKVYAPHLIDRFVEQAVIAYFSDPAVFHALTGKRTPLFPQHTVMPDMDYDLLEPVLANCRGHAND